MSEGFSASDFHAPGWERTQSGLAPAPVVIADDDPDICDEVALYLRWQGYAVSTVHNGGALVRTLDRGKQGAVVMLDVAMPCSNVCDTLTGIARLDSPIVLILCSGQYGHILENVACLARAKNLLVAGILPKPVVPGQLCNLLGEASAMWASHPLKLSLGPQDIAAHPRPLSGEPVTEDELRSALDNHEFKIAVQPLYAPREDACPAVEALARWEHPVRGLLSPARFLPEIRRYGLLLDFTRQIVEDVFSWARHWAEQGYMPDIGFNLPPSLLADGRLAEFIIEEAARHGVDPVRVILELTEDEILPEPEMVLDALVRLRITGFRIAIDDFGAEYAALNRLMWLPISIVKIDRSLIVAEDSSQAPIIVENIVELARKLNLTVIAEGIEDEATLEKMTALGCDLIQGFVIERPMPPETLLPWALSTPSQAKALHARVSVSL